ncbi:LOW QUALITY PROTEIN: NHL-repeat-containing protein 4 [Hippopotamus amphibius kiboko]|uniref:LOW QUALITY PROTEIN: NHL-repeat-containing protein 4 n=1 Tax=Hippopotamus amphibius kiboko TaxID=575201 RepID=UPI002598E5C3|nr:LOW QUALITY PROTEIN: NHL-repeat-containing protein 4 [Hippopotamus amphibius kiboko]
MLGLEGPCWVGLGPDGGLAVREELGDVRLFGSAHQPLGSLVDLTCHRFGSPAGVCTDAADSIVVADGQRRQVTLFPWARAPICLVSKGLRQPLGVACAPQGQLVVADAEDGYSSPTWSWPDLVRLNGRSPSLCVGPDQDGRNGQGLQDPPALLAMPS